MVQDSDIVSLMSSSCNKLFATDTAGATYMKFRYSILNILLKSRQVVGVVPAGSTLDSYEHTIMLCTITFYLKK